MNDRDVLKRASEDLRDATEPTAAELAALRARVLSKNVRPLASRSRSRTLRWLLPLAAALVTGSALAATPGAWQGLVDAVERYLPVELLSPAREAAHQARKRSSKPPPPPPAAVPSAAEPALLEPTAQPEPAQAETSTAHEAPPAVVAPAAPRKASAERTAAAHPVLPVRNEQPAATNVTEPAAPEAEPEPAPKAASSAELALYRPAHELHFRARNFGAALAAWDAYLSRFPQGTLALEAEYNRALCLMRLGRYAEARTALAPFAAGARSGGYRRSEATRFLQAMEKVP